MCDVLPLYSPRDPSQYGANVKPEASMDLLVRHVWDATSLFPARYWPVMGHCQARSMHGSTGNTSVYPILYHLKGLNKGGKISGNQPHSLLNFAIAVFQFRRSAGDTGGGRRDSVHLWDVGSIH